VRSLDNDELRRALAAAAVTLIAELEQTDSALAARLRPAIEAMTTRQTEAFVVSS
jgi:hypothetical protein